MKTTPRQDIAGSLRLQLDRFFRYCPDGDCLTAEDTAEKYDVELSWAYKTLKAMVSEGVLETTAVQSRKMNRMVVAYRAVARIPA